MSSSRQSKDIDVKIMKLDVFRLVSLVIAIHLVVSSSSHKKMDNHKEMFQGK